MPTLSVSAKRDYAAAYRREHKKEISAANAIYRAAHKEEARAYRNTHREELRAYALAWTGEHGEAKRVRDRKAQAEFLEWLQILRTVNGCEDCETHEGLLDHHHFDPSTKRYNVSGMYNSSLDALEEELEKCVVLCRGCHKKRHKTMEH